MDDPTENKAELPPEIMKLRRRLRPLPKMLKRRRREGGEMSYQSPAELVLDCMVLARRNGTLGDLWKGEGNRPNYDYIADQTGLAPVTVRHALLDLEAKGHVVRCLYWPIADSSGRKL